MIIGLDKFKSYFEEFQDNYLIIGGTACDIIIEEAGLKPRATKDIDMILIVEALSSEFVKRFWTFIKDGQYSKNEKTEEDRQFYRFINPSNKDFPHQIELFSRAPDVIDIQDDVHLTPIPVGDDISSLSAILLDEKYYDFIVKNTKLENGVHIANIVSLIVMKAKAFMDLSERKKLGQNVDSRNINKHKTDIFRLGVMLTDTDRFNLPEPINKDLMEFFHSIESNIPSKAIFKEMGIGNIDSDLVLKQIITALNLNNV